MEGFDDKLCGVITKGTFFMTHDNATMLMLTQIRQTVSGISTPGQIRQTLSEILP
jgi:hypothetical protein